MDYRGADNPNNPHSSSLSQLFVSLCHTPSGYITLTNGQMIRKDTAKRWKKEGRL